MRRGRSEDKRPPQRGPYSVDSAKESDDNLVLARDALLNCPASEDGLSLTDWLIFRSRNRKAPQKLGRMKWN
jgi:hypothetical protein